MGKRPRRATNHWFQAVSRLTLPRALPPVVLFIAVVVTFSPALLAGFLDYDDPGYVTMNAPVRMGITPANLRWALTATDQYNWHPVTWMSHQLDSELFGLHAWGHHLTSILLHAAAAVILCIALSRMTGLVWRSFTVAALFALHPLRVESVVWISERKDVLSGLFFALTLWSYARFHRPATTARPKTWYILSLAFFALGLMSKPMLVTVPFVLLLLDYWPLNRSAADALGGQASDSGNASRRFNRVLEKVPFFVLSLGSCVVTFLVQQRGGAIIPVERLPLEFRIENAVISYARYLGKIFWPVDLAAFYPAPDRWPMAAVVLAGCLLAAISLLVVRARRRAPYALVGWFWFVGMLVPVIGLVQVGAQAMADRYSYLPSIGVMLGLVWLAGDFLARLTKPVIWGTGLALAAAAACVVLTIHQTRFWRDTETLARHALAATPNNHIAHNLLGLALFSKGQPEASIREFQEAIRLKPQEPDSYSFLGRVWLSEGRPEEAVRSLQTALALDPKVPDGHRSLAEALERIGRAEDARLEFERHLELNPGDALARNELGLVLLNSGRLEEAIGAFNQALAVSPQFGEAHNNLGIALCRKGEWDAGLTHFEKAVKLKPQAAEHHNNLGIALVKKGRREEAISQFKEALRLQPNYPGAEQQLRALLQNP